MGASAVRKDHESECRGSKLATKTNPPTATGTTHHSGTGPSARRPNQSGGVSRRLGPKLMKNARKMTCCKSKVITAALSVKLTVLTTTIADFLIQRSLVTA